MDTIDANSGGIEVQNVASQKEAGILHEVIIIGSGPAGLTAALYAARAELAPLVIAGFTPGGQLMMTTEVENFPGFIQGIMGPDLMNNMIKQAERFGTKLVYEVAVGVDFKDGSEARSNAGAGADAEVRARAFTIKTDKSEYRARAVILAMGADANWLGLPNEQRLRGKGVSACATCDGFFFKAKEVAVVGGGDSAMEEANFLTKYANKAVVVHRRGEFKASKIMLERARQNPKIEFVMNSEVADVLGADKVEGLRLRNTVSGEFSELRVDGLFLAIGHSPNTKILQGKVELDERGYVKVSGNTRTSVEGIFVAGDISDPRYRQAVTAAGMGCMAALDVEKFLAEK